MSENIFQKSDLPPEVIRKIREAKKNNQFRREIVSTEPYNVAMDRYHLSCGHNTIGFTDRKTPTFDCEECEGAWIKEQL